MQGLALLSELSASDLDWVFNIGVEQQVIANTYIIKEGSRLDSLFFILEGMVGVTISSLEDKQVATLGPGEVVGEMSFIQDVPTNASVIAIENSLLLALPRKDLGKKLEEDAHFAARFYRAVALKAARRLSHSVDTMGQMWNDRSVSETATNEVWDQLSGHIHSFKELMSHADQQALKNDGQIPEEIVAQIEAGFRGLALMMNETIGDASTENEYFKQELGTRIQREILPYLLLTSIGERIYSKPRGYAGDFFTIELMYRNSSGADNRLGPIIDQCFMKEPAAVAVRNRRGLLREEITKVLAAMPEGSARITSLACGPAAELFDVFEELEDKTRLKATLIDIDLQALAFVGDKRDKLKLSRQMDMVNGNLVYLATGRQALMLKPQDLIYSIGLIDYFNDKFVTMLLNYVHGLLKEGGKVILGNFHPKNTSKALMDYVLDWKLIHRTEEDMNLLFRNSAFGKDCTNIRFEEAGVNLFAECTR